MTQKSLRDSLFNLFGHPVSFFTEHTLGIRSPDSELSANVADYIERHQKMLMAAKHFVIDAEAESLFAKLYYEMKEAGLEDTFRTVKFPFPYILIESGRDLGGKAICLLVQGHDDGEFYSECFVGFPDGIAPNSSVVLWNGNDGRIFSSPIDPGDDEKYRGQKDQELRLNSEFVGMFVAMATLLNYDDMLVTEERSFYSRAERRRAEKSGDPLPNAKNIVVSLGKLGKGQLQAMSDNTKGATGITKRAHWVRGHFMRNPSGGLSWRNPHIRGAGTPIEKTRKITG